jgi:hypothetical protein
MEAQATYTPEQRSSEWFNQRIGKFTSSEIYKLMTEPRAKAAKDAGELSEGAKTYVRKKIAEQYGFIPDYTTEAMAWGVEQEFYAKAWYEKLTGNRVAECGFIEVSPTYGGSPDGKVFEGIAQGALEVKCPFSSEHHIGHCMIDSAEYFKIEYPEYYWQCVSHMIVLNVEWCDFVSFDSRIDKEIGLFVFRLELDKADAERLKAKVQKATEYLNEVKTKLKLA